MTKPISPLRQRMIDDMAFRNMSPNTRKVYTYAVANFNAFHGRSPDKLGIEDVRAYRLHLMARGLKTNSINPIIGALRFFYGTTLGQKEVAEQIGLGAGGRRPSDARRGLLSANSINAVPEKRSYGVAGRSIHRLLRTRHDLACRAAR